MDRLKISGVLAAIALLSACSTPNLDRLGQTAATGGTAFTQALFNAYKTAAADERAEEITGSHAEVFAAKANAAATGSTVLPEDAAASAWGTPIRHGDDLAAARTKLIDVLDRGGRESSPEAAATAQAKFDCWVEEATEPGQDEDENACRKAFEAALAQISAVGQAPAAAQAVPGAPAKQFQIYFDFDKAVLTADAQETVVAVAKAARSEKAAVVLTGKADLSGTGAYNLKLSKRRASAVEAALIKLGVPRQQISAKWVGDREPPVPTPAGVREARNRVVEVSLR